ncbi:MAG TPA: sulfatase [Pirellulaceae bacterium]
MCGHRFALLVFCISCWSWGAGAADKPNLVVFICDDLGCLDTTPYGATDVKTPNMQRLANEGLRFTQAFVASPSCAPSRAALLTGLMPARNGAEPNHSRPKEEIKKLPAYLQELGYEVASFGKVAHYGHGPFYGFDVVGGEGFARHEGIGLAADFLKNHNLDKRKSDKPLALFVGTHWPHVPWPDKSEYDPAAVKLPAEHFDTPEFRRSRTRYYEAVTSADKFFGQILDAVDQTLDRKNTYVFFTSDHGAQLPFGKWNLYDAGMRVPLIAAGPGIKANATTDAMVSWIDILPTLVDLAGGKPPSDIDGRSFAAVLRGDKQSARNEIYATHSGDKEFNVYPMRALRTDKYKYILNLHPEFQYATHINRGGERDGLDYFRSWESAAKTDSQAAHIVHRYKERPREELYDLTADPHELKNLADRPEQQSRLSEMRDKVAAWMKEQNDAGTVFDKPLMLGQEATQLPTGAGKAKATNKK